MIERGLVIREPWIGKILRGEKTWELRSRATTRRGWIALIRQGSGLVVGVARLHEVLPPLDWPALQSSAPLHGVGVGQLPEVWEQGWVVPWVLKDVRVFDRPVPYQHKPGAVTWVDLSGCNLPEWQGTEPPHPLLPTSAAASKGHAEAGGSPPAAITVQPFADIELTGGAVKQGYLPLRSAIALLPDSAIGGSNLAAAGTKICVHLPNGVQVASDVDGAKMLLRARGPFHALYAELGLQPGAVLRLTRMTESEFALSLVP